IIMCAAMIFAPARKSGASVCRLAVKRPLPPIWGRTGVNIWWSWQAGTAPQGRRLAIRSLPTPCRSKHGTQSEERGMARKHVKSETSLKETTGTDSAHERANARPDAEDLSDPKEVWKDAETTPAADRARD